MPGSIVKRILHYNQMLPEDTCFITTVFSEMIKFDYLYIMCLLCIDKCLKLNFPIFYRNHVTNARTFLVVAAIVICQVFLFSYRILYIDISAFECTHPITDPQFKPKFFELLILFGICIAVCIQMTYITKKRRGQLRKEASQIVLLNDILAVLFIFSYLPTVAHQYTLMYYEHRGHDDWHNDITELVRYVTPLSNGFALYFTRPAYKESFKLLLKTNPLNWRNIKRETQSKKMAEFSQFTRPIQNFTRPTLVNFNLDNCVPSPCDQIKSEQVLQTRSTDNLGKSKSDIKDLSLTSVKSIQSVEVCCV